MKGWLYTDINIPLKLIEKPDPKAVPGEVVVDVKAAGLCHTDVAALEDEGWRALTTARPMIFGHESAGVISEIGAGVTGWKIGDRVGIHPISKAGEYIGFHRDGGYATKELVPADTLVKIPDKVSFALGAMAVDAGMTSYQGVRLANVTPGMKVGLIGIGGLGQLAARVLKIKGAEIYGVDISPQARELGMKLGMKQVFENVMDLKAIKPPAIIDYAGFGTTTSEALECVAKFGRVIVIGMGKLEAKINTYTLILSQAQIIGSNGGTHQDIADVYDLFASGQLQPELTTISFEDISDGLDRLKRGEVKGRLVALV